MSHSNKLFLILIILLTSYIAANGQSTVAFQGFEGTATDNWAYTPPTQGGATGLVPVGAANYGAGYAKTGSFSMRAGGGSTSCATGSGNCVNGSGNGGSCTNLPNGKIVQFNPVNVECLSGVQIAVSHRSHVFCGGQGQGFDSGENLFFEVSLNGGAWTAVGTLGGFSNYVWTFATNPAGSGSTVANPFVYNVPAGTVNVAFRTRCVTDRSDEVYYIDDVKLTTTTTGYNFPGTAGLWNGKVNTDWTNKCNWDNRILPTTATDVNIPNAALNICEILPGLTGNCRNIVINKSKLAAEYFSSTLNVTGNLTIDLNGELDMSLAANEGGTLNLSGNWLNKQDETFFKEGKSTVNFIGSANQTITINNDSKEAYYKATVNKTSGAIIANTDIWIDKANVGGAASMLSLSNGLFDLNSNQLTVWNPNFQAISRTGGGIVSEKVNNSSPLIWEINSSMGNFVFPFARLDGTYIPFTFNHISGNAGSVSVATYGTPANNLPWPTTPVLVTDLNSSIGLSPDNRDATVDRFWQIDVTGSPTTTLTFSYAPSELPIAPFNNPTTMKGQRFTNVTNKWLNYLPGQSASAYTVTVPSVTSFSTWTLTNILSPLPVELLYFNAKPVKKEVNVTWSTASEINNDFFTVQRSNGGIDFEDIGSEDGAGSSNTILNYSFTDSHPYEGLSYYRLQQTDFDGKFSFSRIVTVNMHTSQLPLTIDFIHTTENSLNAFLQVSELKPVNVQLVDMLGRIVYARNFVPENISFTVYLNTSFLSTGMYVMKVDNGVNQQTQKCLVK